MEKRVFIIHGWGGYPGEGWMKWLGRKLEEKGFKVVSPAMPETDEPKIEKWVPFLEKQIGETNENTNGLIRDYFPKKTDFTKISDQEIQQVEYFLNARPRKRLGFKTPLEVFSVALEG